MWCGAKVFVLWNALMYDQKQGAFYCCIKHKATWKCWKSQNCPFIDLCQISALNRESGGMEQWRIVSVLMLDQLEQDPLGAAGGGVTNYTNDDKVCTGK